MAIALLIARLVLGGGMFAHGAQKLFGWFGGYGIKGTGGWMESMGFKPGNLFAAAAGLGEAGGGLLTALGIGGPLGPALVTVDEFDHPDDLELGCRLGDEVLQLGRTRDLIFSVPELIARLSAVCPLLPGDIIFTGTPAGVGMGRSPQVWLQPGDEVISYVEGIGELRQHCVAG